MSTLTGKTLALAVAVAAASALPVGANPSPFDALPASVRQNLPRIQRPLPSPRPRPLPLPTRSCPDPAAQAINFQMIARTDQFRGRVRIGGTIRNQASRPIPLVQSSKLPICMRIPGWLLRFPFKIWPQPRR